jgi:hypothetical protein
MVLIHAAQDREGLVGSVSKVFVFEASGSIYLSLSAALGTGVYSTSNRNEYQK